MESNEEITPEVPLERPFSPTRYLFLIGVSLYCAVVWYVGWNKVRDALVSAQLSYLLLSGLIILAGTWARAWKWRYALGAGHDAIGLFFLSKATGNVSPGRLGEFSPMVLKRHRHPKMGAWIMFDRVLEVFVTLGLGLIGLGMIRLFSNGTFVALSVATIALAIAGVYLLTRRAFFLWLAQRSTASGWTHRFAMLFAAISTELFEFVRSLPLTGLITIVTKCADLWAVALIFLALGYDPGLGLVAAAKCALAIVSFVPITPTATAVPHLTQAWLMNRVAGIPLEVLAVGIGIEAVIVSVTFWTSFGLAGIHIRGAARKS